MCGIERKGKAQADAVAVKKKIGADLSDIHAGHRERLRERARKEGIAAFQKHEVLELLLMQVIPQRDVNPLAHVLIRHFGGLEKVLAASQEELREVSGVGPRTAQWLRAVGELCFAYVDCWVRPQETILNSAQAIGFLRRNRLGRVGDFAMVCLDRAGHVVYHSVLAVGRDGFPGARDMVSMALLHHASQVFSIHFAFGEETTREETEFAIQASDTFTLLKIDFLDHIVCAGGKYHSARRAGVIDYVQADDAIAAEMET